MHEDSTLFTAYMYFIFEGERINTVLFLNPELLVPRKKNYSGNVGCNLETFLMVSKSQHCTCKEPEGSTRVEGSLVILSAGYTPKADHNEMPPKNKTCGGLLSDLELGNEYTLSRINCYIHVCDCFWLLPVRCK